MEVQENVQLAPYTTFGIGGPADYFIIAKTQEEIIEAVTFAKNKHIPFFILGSGSNILVGDKGYRGLVIKNEAKKMTVNDTVLTAESGVLIDELIAITTEKNLSGFEHFAGIPSTVGGAMWQNLHFLSPDRSATVFIGNIITSAKILKDDGTVQEVDASYFNFAYDYSILHETKEIVLEVTCQLIHEDKLVLEERIAANLAWRREKHPINAVYASAGSIFKKIEAYGAGRLVEQVGLKGKQIGGAKISDHHANFIINVDGAKAADVLALIALVKKTINEKLGLQMQTEIGFIGDF